MEVYIEYVIADNLILDYLLLKTARRSLKLECSFWRIALSAVLGTAAACVLPLFRLNKGALFFIKVVLGALLVIIAGKFEKPKQIFECFNLFLFFTFLFGGAVIGIFYLLGINYASEEYFYYNTEVPLGIIIGSAFIIYVCCKKILKFIYRKKDIYPFVKDCELSVNGFKITLKGFMDSGNRLSYYRSGAPIVLCSPELSVRLKTSGALTGARTDYITFNTVAGRNSMAVYKIDYLLIYNDKKPNIINNVMIGLSPNGFKDGGEYDLILHPGLQ